MALSAVWAVTVRLLWTAVLPSLAQELGLGVDGVGHVVAEAGFVEQGGQVVIVGVLEGGVVAVEPVDGQFQRAAGVEAGAARVGLDVPVSWLNPFRVLVEEFKIETGVKDAKLGLVLAGAEQIGRKRVPRPIIWKNLVLERTTLKKTRLTTSGTSMPVSSISTEMAMCGSLCGLLKSSIRDWA